ncbi:Alcohol dehydrogenase YqhD [Escherichia coli]|nr:Alcohol dehydrogenase YqhD [Escherichia coli]
MWAATMALNGMLSAGVPTDWASHDWPKLLHYTESTTPVPRYRYACTMALVQKEKAEKLAQYGARVWNIPESDSENGRNFFELMGVKTRLSDYGLGAEDISAVIGKLKEHGHIALGEHGKITAEVAETILNMAL